MRSFQLTELQEPLGAQLLGVDASFNAVSIDSRAIGRDQLFVALPGPSFDGHDFVAAAAQGGAGAALISERRDYPLPCLQVADTRLALGQLAALNRGYFGGKLIGITGSSGKTSVKNMLAAILGRVGATLATEGNFNNEIGVPLTLLKLQPQHQFAVIEMGASRGGDISYLVQLAQPAIAILLNALPAHLQGFGSVAGVARAKAEIFGQLGAAGTAVINADSEYAPLWRELAGDAQVIEFGSADSADVCARCISDRGAMGSSFTLTCAQGEQAVKLALPGMHNIANALAAAAAAVAAGVALADIVAGLETVHAAPGRLLTSTTAAGALLIDDSYNANPGSVRAAIDVLAATPGHSVLVLGAMAELGADSAALHADIGRYARERGVDELWLSGAEAAPAAAGYGAGAVHCAEVAMLTQQLAGRFVEGDVILVKGSRSAGMEVVVSALLAQQGKGD